MASLLPFLVVITLAHVVLGWGFHESCRSIEQPLTRAMDVAFRRANDAVIEIRRNPRQKHVDELVKMLFGSDDATITNAAERLENVVWQRVHWDRPLAYDVIVYCSTDRITERTDGVEGYMDTDRNKPARGRESMDNCRSANLDGKIKTRALTVNAGSARHQEGEYKGEKTKETMPDILQLCPWFLRQVAGPPSTYDTPDDLIQKAASVKARNILEKLVSKIDGEEEFARPIDSLAGFEHVLLHELTHSATAGYADDTPANKCYGWRNSVKCKLSQNADSLAYFALAVELVLHRGYTVNKEGWLQKID